MRAAVGLRLVGWSGEGRRSGKAHWQEQTHFTMRMTTTTWKLMKYSFAAWCVTRAKPSARSAKLRHQTCQVVV